MAPLLSAPLSPIASVHLQRQTRRSSPTLSLPQTAVSVARPDVWHRLRQLGDIRCSRGGIVLRTDTSLPEGVCHCEEERRGKLRIRPKVAAVARRSLAMTEIYITLPFFKGEVGGVIINASLATTIYIAFSSV